jgi:hypothetical protein
MAFSAFFAISAFTYINILDYGLMGGLPSIGWGLVLSTIFYLIFIHPKVIFFDEGLTIVNPLTTITLGWHDVVEIDARFTMYVVHRKSGAKIHAFAAQAPGRYHSRTVHPNEVKGMRVGDSGMIRAGESPRTSSGAATAIARARLEQFERFQSQGSVEFSSKFNKSAAVIGTAFFAIALVIQVIHP